MKRTPGTLVSILAVISSLVTLASGVANAGPSYEVSVNGKLDGDGSAARPFRRITDAVSRARQDRAAKAVPPSEEIRIHVASGAYVGTYEQKDFRDHPEYEVLPIILNVPRLRVVGDTGLDLDKEGLPVGAKAGTETVLRPKGALGGAQSLFLITRTQDGSVGDDIVVSGFVLDGKLPPDDPNGGDKSGTVWIDRVAGFTLTGNVMTGANHGFVARLASGRIEGNLLTANADAGGGVEDGSNVFPAKVVVSRNRFTKNRFQGFAVSAVPRYPELDLGANAPLKQPKLEDNFDRAKTEDLQKIPDHLDLTVTGNDIGDNNSGGIRCLATSVLFYRTQKVAQPITASLVMKVEGNTIGGNRDYGIILDAGFPDRSEQRSFVASFSVALNGNKIARNGRNAGFFCFTRAYVWLGEGSLDDNKYLEQSKYDVADPDKEIAGFDYDNPEKDPVSGTAVANALVVNGTTAPNGQKITKP